MVSPISVDISQSLTMSDLAERLELIDPNDDLAPLEVTEPSVRVAFFDEVPSTYCWCNGPSTPVRISAVWKKQSIVRLPLPTNIGICYVSSSNTSYEQCLEDCLELSRIFQGIEIQGIHNQNRRFECSHQRNATVLAALVEMWEEYFKTNSEGHLLQYFHGDGANLVQKALKHVEAQSSSRISLVGMNPTVCPEHPMKFYCRSKWDFRSKLTEGVLQLPLNGNANGVYSLRFIDPTFISAIIQMYLVLTNAEYADIDESGVIVPEDILNLLGYDMPNCKRSKLIRTIELYKHNDEELFNNAVRLRLARDGALGGKEKWHEGRIRSIYNTLAAYLKVAINLFLVAENIKGKHNVPACVGIISSAYHVLECFAEILLVIFPNASAQQSYRIYAQIPGWFRIPVNCLMMLVNIIIGANATNVARKELCFTLATLTAVDSVNICVDTNVFSMLHRRMMQFSMFMTNLKRPEVRKYSRERTERVGRSYRKTIRHARFFFQLLCSLTLLGSIFSLNGYKAIYGSDNDVDTNSETAEGQRDLKAENVSAGVFAGSLTVIMALFLYYANLSSSDADSEEDN